MIFFLCLVLLLKFQEGIHIKKMFYPYNLKYINKYFLLLN